MTTSPPLKPAGCVDTCDQGGRRERRGELLKDFSVPVFFGSIFVKCRLFPEVSQQM